MSRKTRVYKKNIVSSKEPLFNDNILLKFTNCLMYSGKKSVAENILYDSFLLIKKELGQNPLDIFHLAIENVTPVVQVMSIRIAGSNYQVPMEIPPHKQSTLAIKWIIESSRSRSEKSMSERLAKEFIDAYKNIGKSIEKKQTLHKMAEANRAYAHYRW